jgi:hypothetical protein
MRAILSAVGKGVYECPLWVKGGDLTPFREGQLTDLNRK